MSSRASHIAALSDDLLAHIFSSLDCTTLRSIAWTCKRWSAVLQEHLQLWHTVSLALHPKISRGRDRRNSYTMPCLLDTTRLGAWLAQRGHHIRQVQLVLGYPDALLLLPQLLLPLAPALQRLELLGAASRNWVHVEANWHWLRYMPTLCAQQPALEAGSLQCCIRWSISGLALSPLAPFRFPACWAWVARYCWLYGLPCDFVHRQ